MRWGCPERGEAIGRPRWLQVALVVALGLLFSGCQASAAKLMGESATPTAPPSPAATRAAPATPQPSPSPRPVGRPPQVTLRAHAGTQQGRLGSYCWEGHCVNAIGRVVSLQPLPVVQYEEARFIVDGDAPSSFHLAAFAVDHGRLQRLADGVSQAWHGQSTAPVAETTLGGAEELPYAPDLAPGQYVLDLRGEWGIGEGTARRGASYGFLVEVTEARVGEAALQVGKLSLDRARLREYQGSVDAGHQPWRLEPLPVAVETGRVLGFDPDADTFTLVSQQFDERAGTWRAVVRVSHGGQSYEMELVQPIKVGQGGIWAVTEVRMVEATPTPVP